MMDYYSGKKSKIYERNENPPTKNQILQQYRQTERQKSILKNKLNIIKKTCQANHKKSKTIQSELKKVNKIKQKYKLQRNQIQSLLQKNKQEQQKRKNEISQRKQNQRGRIPYIRRMLQRERSNDYMQMKKKHYEIQNKIKVYRNSVITERKKTIHKIKSSEEIGKMNRTLFMQIKKKSARMHVEEQAAGIERKFERNRLELSYMRDLEDSLVDKLNKSRTSLRNSMSRVVVSKGNRGMRA